MNRVVTTALTPLSGLYHVATGLRRRLYASGVFRVHELSVPVISVGNITVGGTGKTPLVEWIARELAGLGHHVCILTRGYKRVRPNDRVLVSDGEAVLSDPQHAGDEAFLLAENLKGQAAVISNIDRVAAADWAIENLKSDVFLLDDGFQNIRIARKLNIVTIDATNPWGNGRLLPAGTLREPRTALDRADCVVITRVNESNQVGELSREINQLNRRAPVFQSRMRLSGIEQVAQSTDGSLSPNSVAAFCGIANPESFFRLLRTSGLQLCHTQVFPDHYAYEQADLDRITRVAVSKGARAMIVTAKDEVKLRSLNSELPLFVANVQIDIEESETLSRLIKEAARSGRSEDP